MRHDSEVDRSVANELAGFVPERVFDAHAHVYRVADLGEGAPALVKALPNVVDAAYWREQLGAMMPAARVGGGLLMPYPIRGGDVNASNSFLIAQLAANESCRGEVIVTPDMTVASVESWLAQPRVAGFKPYHVYAAIDKTYDAPLNAFLPEWAWELAHAKGLSITVHLVRSGALADPDNQREIVRMCRKYPNARLILAHAARGFHAPNTVKAIRTLRGLENVWFDASAICEATPFLAILNEFGPRKLMWGSDFPVSQQRGRAVTMGDGFVWIEPEHADPAAPECHATLVGLESLRALREAADLFGLNREDIADVFHNNACRLLGIIKEPANLTQDLYLHAKERMPGGTQLLSKRPEMFAPNQWPGYFREARGCEIWDLDGRHYYDMTSNGIGACLLGYRDPDVTRAVQRRINLGSMSTLNPPEEVALADTLCTIHPWAERVRFTRCGGEACAVAARIARATTDRSIIAICGYHGWSDWYLAANLGESDALLGHLLPGLDPLGVPRELRGSALTFKYNARDELQRILDAHGDRLAAVIMEPMRYYDPEPGFLEFVRDSAHSKGALLIFDEVSIGWRRCYGGSHLELGVNPDLAIFAKAMGNGHPIGAVIGTRAAMEGAHSSFISSTYWTESVGPTAALATLKKMKEVDAAGHSGRIGRLIQTMWRECAKKHGLPIVVDPGIPCLAHYKFEHEKALALRTLYTQLMLERGFLASAAIYPTCGHTEEIVERFGQATDDAFGELARAIESNSIEQRLKGPIAHETFRRLL